VDRFQKCKLIAESKINSFKEAYGYLPPYWQMVRIAEESLNKKNF
jgi:hypothetical protein